MTLLEEHAHLILSRWIVNPSQRPPGGA
ncbi:hypothetical protein DFAR_10008 [Desulfarculales bacterium]